MINRANFAEIDVTNTVIRVVTVDADEILKNGPNFAVQVYHLTLNLNTWQKNLQTEIFRQKYLIRTS